MRDGRGYAAIFDMDGLMFDTERLAEKAFFETGRRMGLPMTQKVTGKTIGRDRTHACEVFREHFGADVDAGCIWDGADEYMRRSVTENGLPLKAGVTELLDYLRNRDYRIALATGSGTGIVGHYFAGFSHADRFDARICGDMVKRGKPDPEVFLTAARAVGVPPRKCIVFEDSPAGILAAFSAGMHAVMVPDMIPAGDDEYKRAEVLDSLLEVPAYLDALEPF